MAWEEGVGLPGWEWEGPDEELEPLREDLRAMRNYAKAPLFKRLVEAQIPRILAEPPPENSEFYVPEVWPPNEDEKRARSVARFSLMRAVEAPLRESEEGRRVLERFKNLDEFEGPGIAGSVSAAPVASAAETSKGS